jgi:proteasome lid subunit RPN8/RPN11
VSQLLLRFTPYAWARLLILRDAGDTEIGAFGLTRPNDPLLIEDIILPDQHCTSATTEFDDTTIAKFFEDMVEKGHQPTDFGRVWIHTHPGNSPNPSNKDEETFNQVFGRCDHAIMFILAKDDSCYARLQLRKPFPITTDKLKVVIDYLAPISQETLTLWRQDYAQHITSRPFVYARHWWNSEENSNHPTTAKPAAVSLTPEEYQAQVKQACRALNNKELVDLYIEHDMMNDDLAMNAITDFINSECPARQANLRAAIIQSSSFSTP